MELKFTDKMPPVQGLTDLELGNVLLFRKKIENYFDKVEEEVRSRFKIGGMEGCGWIIKASERRSWIDDKEKIVSALGEGIIVVKEEIMGIGEFEKAGGEIPADLVKVKTIEKLERED